MSSKLQCPNCGGAVVTTRLMWRGHPQRHFACRECDTQAWVPEQEPGETARQAWNRWCWERRQEAE